MPIQHQEEITDSAARSVFLYHEKRGAILTFDAPTGVFEILSKNGKILRFITDGLSCTVSVWDEALFSAGHGVAPESAPRTPHLNCA